MIQPLLFDPPPPLSHAELVTRATDYVRSALRLRPCVSCCGSERLAFVHRRPAKGDREVSDLARLGADLVRLREEMGKCDVICRRCLLARPHPQMLRFARLSLGRNRGEGQKPVVLRSKGAFPPKNAAPALTTNFSRFAERRR